MDDCEFISTKYDKTTASDGGVRLKCAVLRGMIAGVTIEKLGRCNGYPAVFSYDFYRLRLSGCIYGVINLWFWRTHSRRRVFGRRRRDAHVHTMFAVGMLGVLIGDSCMFLAGRYFGARLLQHRYFARMMTPERYAAVQDKFERYGNRVLFVARFLPGLRTPIYLTAGMSGRISYFRFLLLDGLAALISVPIWVYLGYYGASNHEWLIKWLGRGQSAIMVLVALVAVIVAVWYFRHCRKPK